MEKVSSWRPSNWKNPYNCWENLCFERGANAMILALEKRGEYIEEGKVYASPCGGCNSDEDCSAYDTGTIVFIPKEKKVLKKVLAIHTREVTIERTEDEVKILAVGDLKET